MGLFDSLKKDSDGETESKFLTAEEFLKINQLTSGQKEVIGFIKLASGSSRDVYSFRGGKYVVKIERGDTKQNTIESKVFEKANDDLKELLVPIVEHDPSCRWIVQPKVETAETLDVPKVYRTFNALNESLKAGGISVPDFNPMNIGLLGGKPVITDYGFDVKYTKNNGTVKTGIVVDSQEEKHVPFGSLIDNKKGSLLGGERPNFNFLETIKRVFGLSKGETLFSKIFTDSQREELEDKIEPVARGTASILAEFWGMSKTNVLDELPKIRVFKEDEYPGIKGTMTLFDEYSRLIIVNAKYITSYEKYGDQMLNSIEPALAEEICHFMESYIKKEMHVSSDSNVKEFFGMISRLYVADKMGYRDFNSEYRRLFGEALNFKNDLDNANSRVDKMFGGKLDDIEKELASQEELLDKSLKSGGVNKESDEIKNNLSKLLGKMFAESHLNIQDIEAESVRIKHMTYHPAYAYYYQIIKMKPEERFALLSKDPSEIVTTIMEKQERKLEAIKRLVDKAPDKEVELDKIIATSKGRATSESLKAVETGSFFQNVTKDAGRETFLKDSKFSTTELDTIIGSRQIFPVNDSKINHDIISSIANMIDNSQSKAHVVDCALTGASQLYSYSQLLKTTKYSNVEVSSELEYLAQMEILVSRLMIVINSLKTPHKLYLELAEKAMSHSPRFLVYLQGKEKDDAHEALRSLRNSKTLVQVTESLNSLAYSERDGFAIARNKRDIALPEDFDRMNRSFQDKFRKKLTLNSYDFLSSFDPELSRNVFEHDTYFRNGSISTADNLSYGINGFSFLDPLVNPTIEELRNNSKIKEVERVSVSDQYPLRAEMGQSVSSSGNNDIYNQIIEDDKRTVEETAKEMQNIVDEDEKAVEEAEKGDEEVKIEDEKEIEEAEKRLE